MSAYIKKLRELEQAEASQAMATSEEEKKAARERLTPLEVRLAKLLAAIPAEVQKEGLSLAALQKQLKGRWRGCCHPGELGSALRKLGYRRMRKSGLAMMALRLFGIHRFNSGECNVVAHYTFRRHQIL